MSAHATGRDRFATSGAIGPGLVVEDDPVVALLVADTLRDAGAAPVEICATTEAARDALERLCPALVILDVHLADRDDGWALAELLSALGPQTAQVIFATATPEAIPQAVAALGTVLPKPFAPAQLQAAIDRKRPASLMTRLREALSGTP